MQYPTQQLYSSGALGPEVEVNAVEAEIVGARNEKGGKGLEDKKATTKERLDALTLVVNRNVDIVRDVKLNLTQWAYLEKRVGSVIETGSELNNLLTTRVERLEQRQHKLVMKGLEASQVVHYIDSPAPWVTGALFVIAMLTAIFY